MQTEQPRRDNLYYAANLIGLAVLVYLAVSALLQTALAALLAALPGIPAWGTALANCAVTAADLAAPLLCLRHWAAPLGLPPLRLQRPHREAALIGLPLFLCFTTLCGVAANLVRMLLDLGGYVPPQTMRLPEGGALVLSFLSVCLIPAVGEELLFRGTIQKLLSPYGGWFSIIVSSLFFTLLHPDLSQLPSIFAMSLFLGYVAAASGSVANTILLHFANNASSFLLLWSRQQMDGTNAMAFSAVLFTLYFAAGLLALLALIRRGGPRRLPRYPTRRNRMGRTERILPAPFFTFTLLLLVLTDLLEYFR